MKKIFFILIFLLPVITRAQTFSLLFRQVATSTSTDDSAFFQFLDSAHALEQTGASYMVGDLAQVTDSIWATGGLHGGFRLTARKSNWPPMTAASQITNSATEYSINTTNPYLPWATNAMSGLWYDYDGVAGYTGVNATAQLKLIGCNPGGTYVVSMSGAATPQFYNDVPNDFTSNVRVGSTLTSIAAQQTFDLLANSTTPNSTEGASFTVAADSQGCIYIWLFTDGTASAAGIGFVKIKGH